MDFPKQLHRLLSNHDDSSADSETLTFFVSVREWNNAIEAGFGDPQLTSGDCEIESDAIEEASSLLQSITLSMVFNSCSHAVNAECNAISPDVVAVVAAIDSDSAADDSARMIAAIVKRSFDSVSDDGELKLVSELLRACKNMLRFRSQLVARWLDTRKPLTQRLSSNGMLELYISIIEVRHADAARFASLSLFYSTYNPNNDETIQKAQSYLIETLDFLRILTNMLLQCRPTDLVLSLVRHVHNLICAVQGTSKRMSVILMELSANPTDNHDAPWIEGDWNGMGLPWLLVSISAWCLQSDPLFPGNESDRRADLVLECLRVLFVLRAGSSIAEQSVSEEENTTLERLVCELLFLDDKDGRCYACKMATVSVLMDSPPAFSDYLLSCGCIEPLLGILESQVSNVVDHCILGNQAATALTPILVVLNNFSANNTTVLRTVKHLIFPLDAEDSFREKAASQQTCDGKDGIGANNMAPLDAPKQSLRWKMIQLMTWTESHTKRLTSELLWTLCDGDAKEFVWRTGFGNAMPHLASKGLVQLPTEISR